MPMEHCAALAAAEVSKVSIMYDAHGQVVHEYWEKSEARPCALCAGNEGREKLSAHAP